MIDIGIVSPLSMVLEPSLTIVALTNHNSGSVVIVLGVAAVVIGGAATVIAVARFALCGAV